MDLEGLIEFIVSPDLDAKTQSGIVLIIAIPLVINFITKAFIPMHEYVRNIKNSDLKGLNDLGGDFVTMHNQLKAERALKDIFKMDISYDVAIEFLGIYSKSGSSVAISKFSRSFGYLNIKGGVLRVAAWNFWLGFYHWAWVILGLFALIISLILFYIFSFSLIQFSMGQVESRSVFMLFVITVMVWGSFGMFFLNPPSYRSVLRMKELLKNHYENNGIETEGVIPKRPQQN